MCQTLVCLIASHMKNSRITFFEELLASIGNQTRPCKIHISWSAENSVVKKIMKKLLKKVTFPITAIFSTKKKSQFEHFQNLIPHIHKEVTHIMFSDDDDVWASYRVEDIKSAIDAVNDPMLSSIRFLTFESLNESGEKTVTTSCPENYTEYWQVVTKKTIFTQFMRKAPKEVLMNQFCDMRFATWIHAYGGGDWRTLNVETKPGYTYRLHSDSVCGRIALDDNHFEQEIKFLLEGPVPHIIRTALLGLSQMFDISQLDFLLAICSAFDLFMYRHWDLNEITIKRIYPYFTPENEEFYENAGGVVVEGLKLLLKDRYAHIDWYGPD